MLRPVFLKPFEYQAFPFSPEQSMQHGRNTAVRFSFSKGKARWHEPALTSLVRDDWGRCCSKASVRFRFSDPLEILLTVRRDSRSVRVRRAIVETVISIPERQVVYHAQS